MQRECCDVFSLCKLTYFNSPPVHVLTQQHSEGYKGFHLKWDDKLKEYYEIFSSYT